MTPHNEWGPNQRFAVWNAAYAAAMVRQIFDYMHEGRGSPDDAVMAGFREEAEAVADMILAE